MSSTTYVDNTTIIYAAWLNDVNRITYTILGNATTAAQARTALGSTTVGDALFLSSSAANARSTISAAVSGANGDITSLTGLTTPLTVAQGGIGAATLTANYALLGNGTSPPQMVAPGTSGNVLTSNGTTWQSTALPASTGPQYAYTTADFDKTNDTSLANVTGLSVTVTAGTYLIHAALFISTAGGAAQASIGGTATATTFQAAGIFTDSNTNTAASAAAKITAQGSAIVSNNTPILCIIHGTATISVGGTITVQWAQEASSGTPARVLKGSWLKLEKMA